MSDETIVADFTARRDAARRRMGIAAAPAFASSALPVLEAPADAPLRCAQCSEEVRLSFPVRPATIVCNACESKSLIAEREARERFADTAFSDVVNVPAAWAEMSLANWKSAVPPGITRWLKNPERGLVLWGPQGIGKTHLAVACLRALWDAGQRSLWFCEAPTLNDDLMRDIREGAANRTADRLVQRRWVLFDDAARLRQSPFAREAFATIVYQRHSQRKFAIVTTNEDPSALYGATVDSKGNDDHVSGPLWSRLLDGAEIVGPADGLSLRDWRLGGGR